MTAEELAAIEARANAAPALVQMEPEQFGNASQGFAPADTPRRFVVGLGGWVRADEPVAVGVRDLLLHGREDLCALVADVRRLQAVADAARVRMDVVMGMTGWAKADADLRRALHALDNPHLPADAVERDAP